MLTRLAPPFYGISSISHIALPFTQQNQRLTRGPVGVFTLPSRGLAPAIFQLTAINRTAMLILRLLCCR